MKGKSFLVPMLGMLIVFAVWEIMVWVLKIQIYILPPPSAIFSELAVKGGLLIRHSFVTLTGTLMSLGLAIILGVAAGFVIGYSQTISRLFYPLLGGFYALPISALIPILAIWFGIGFYPRLLAGFLIAFFPIVVNVVTGLGTIEPDLWDMLKSIGATKMQVFQKVGIPRTMPYFFAALKVAVAGAFIGNVVAELIAAGEGLGYVLLTATSRFEMSLAFSALLILFIMGLTFFMSFEALEKKVCPWAYRGPEGHMLKR